MFSISIDQFNKVQFYWFHDCSKTIISNALWGVANDKFMHRRALTSTKASPKPIFLVSTFKYFVWAAKKWVFQKWLHNPNTESTAKFVGEHAFDKRATEILWTLQNMENDLLHPFCGSFTLPNYKFTQNLFIAK